MQSSKTNSNWLKSSTRLAHASDIWCSQNRWERTYSVRGFRLEKRYVRESWLLMQSQDCSSYFKM
ncbi:unnamed protein product [Prunus armeniaca]